MSRHPTFADPPLFRVFQLAVPRALENLLKMLPFQKLANIASTKAIPQLWARHNVENRKSKWHSSLAYLLKFSSGFVVGLRLFDETAPSCLASLPASLLGFSQLTLRVVNSLWLKLTFLVVGWFDCLVQGQNIWKATVGSEVSTELAVYFRLLCLNPKIYEATDPWNPAHSRLFSPDTQVFLVVA